MTAYLAHVHPEVTSVDDLALLPEGSIIIDGDGDAFQRSGKTDYSANWYTTGNEDGWMASQVTLPATVIHRPAHPERH